MLHFVKIKVIISSMNLILVRQVIKGNANEIIHVCCVLATTFIEQTAD